MQIINEKVLFQAGVKFLTIPERDADVSILETSLNVLHKEVVILSNASPITITDIQKGQDNQELILLGDGNTTLQHNATIKLISGANTLMAANRAYKFVFINSVWYQL